MKDAQGRLEDEVARVTEQRDEEHAEKLELVGRLAALVEALGALLEHVRECNTQNPDWLHLEECPDGHELECGRCYDVRRARAALAAARGGEMTEEGSKL